MRSNTPFPDHIDKELCACILKFWERGVFDEYSDRHFFIKAINDDDAFFRSFFLQKHYDLRMLPNFAVNFTINLSVKLQCLCDYFGEENVEGFMRDQFSAGKGSYEQEVFFEALSEVHALFHFLNYGPARTKNAEYEPRLVEGKKNPEARIEYENGTVLDIEMKTPRFSERKYAQDMILPSILLTETGRAELKTKSDELGVKCVFPRALKIKDFMNSAGKKFCVPENNQHINLLFINWSESDIIETKLFEPVSLLCNPANGILVDKTVAQSLGITEDALEKITAIFLYIMSEEELLFTDFRYLFKSRDYRIVMNPFCKNADIDCVHELTRMSVHNPEELCDSRFAMFDLHEGFQENDLMELHRIIEENIYAPDSALVE